MLRDSCGAVDRRLDDGPGIRMVDHFNPAGVGARARIEQRACSAHESVGARTVEPEISREAKMGERIPTPGPALSGGAGRIARKKSAYSGLVGNHGGS